MTPGAFFVGVKFSYPTVSPHLQYFFIPLFLVTSSNKVTEDAVKDCVLELSRLKKNRIGRDGLAIAKSFFYEHIANTPILLAQVVRTCMEGT